MHCGHFDWFSEYRHHIFAIHIMTYLPDIFDAATEYLDWNKMVDEFWQTDAFSDTYGHDLLSVLGI
jgi:hypothetical protein